MIITWCVRFGVPQTEYVCTIHVTFLMWAPHVWCCVTDLSSLKILLDNLITNKNKAQSPSPDGKYQIIFNFVKTFHEPLDYVYFIFDRCVVTRLYQQTRFIVPAESVGADRVLIVPEDSGSHRHREFVVYHRLLIHQ